MAVPALNPEPAKTASRADPALRRAAPARRPASYGGVWENPPRYDRAASNGSVVGEDPVNNGDPSGLVCVSDAKSGTTTCTETVTGSRIPEKLTFSTPPGFAPTIKPGDSNYHHYDEAVRTKGDQARAQKITSGIVAHPTPGNDKPASVGGTPNNASPQGGGLVGTVGQAVPSPVRSYVTTDANGNRAVWNVTMPGHPLFPGIVMRMVTQGNGSLTVHNVGEGLGVLQSPALGWTGIPNDINSQWISQTIGIINNNP